MEKNDLTFCSMFPNSLFNRQKNKFVFIFISQISYNKGNLLFSTGTKVPTVTKHGTGVIKQTECFDCSIILCEHSSL